MFRFLLSLKNYALLGNLTLVSVVDERVLEEKHASTLRREVKILSKQQP
ncbi:hypothetical protein [Thermococcus aggregans]